jgi:hypothetical protein
MVGIIIADYRIVESLNVFRIAKIDDIPAFRGVFRTGVDKDVFSVRGADDLAIAVGDVKKMNLQGSG